jgi:hypothetical protein
VCQFIYKATSKFFGMLLISFLSVTLPSLRQFPFHLKRELFWSCREKSRDDVSNLLNPLPSDFAISVIFWTGDQLILLEFFINSFPWFLFHSIAVMVENSQSDKLLSFSWFKFNKIYFTASFVPFFLVSFSFHCDHLAWFDTMSSWSPSITLRNCWFVPSFDIIF